MRFFLLYGLLMLQSHLRGLDPWWVWGVFMVAFIMDVTEWLVNVRRSDD